MIEPNRERRIFDEALNIPCSAERTVFLRQACAGNEELLARLEALVRASEVSSGFLPAEPRGASWDSGVPGARIGRYRLLERIGEGGFGVVYMAEQWEPVRRRVALKVIKPGMDSRQVIVDLRRNGRPSR